MNYSVRLAKIKAERFIDGTMVSLTSREIILKEPYTFKINWGRCWRAKTEDLMGEIFMHEVLHLVLLDLLDEVTSTALDNISGWDSSYPIIQFGKLKKVK